MSLNSIDELIMVDISWGHYNDILSHIVNIVVVFNHLLAYGLHVPDIPQNRQSYLLVTKYSSMSYLYCSL